jgi:HK97 family phage prohead protease
MPLLSDEPCLRAVTDYELRADNTVEALIVPWMTPAPILELVNGAPVAYQEQFARGAFARAEAVPHRVTLAWGHSDDFGNALGRALSFHNQEQGEVGVFRLNSQEASKAREMISDMGLSVSFRSLVPQHGTESEGALVTREQAHLRHVAVVASPAYADTRILAMREQNDVEQAARAARAEADRALASALRLLVAAGRPLSAEQLAWLAGHPE